MASASDAKILDYVLASKTRANARRQLYEDRWYRNWELYRNKGTTRRVRGQQWESNEELADGFRMIESLTPEHIRGMLRNNGWVDVIAPSVAGWSYQDLVKTYLLHAFRKASGPVKVSECVKYANIMGTAISKLTWDTVIGEREVPDVNFNVTAEGEGVEPRFVRRIEPYVRYNGVRIERPSLMDVWLDPTAHNLFVIERMYHSLEWLKEINREFGGRLYKNLNKLGGKNPEEGTAQSSSSIPTAEQMMGGGGVTDMPDMLEQVDGIPTNVGAPADTVQILQFWGWIPPSVKRYEDTQWRLVVIGQEQEVLRDTHCPTPDLQPPFVVTPAVPIPGDIYGESPLTMVEPLIRLKSFIENAKRDEILLNLYPQFIIDRDARISDSSMLRRPGGAIFISNYRGRLAEVIQPIQRAPVLPEAFNELFLKEEQINRIGGVTEHMKGEGLGARATALEAGIVNQSSSGRIQMSVMFMDEMLKRPWFEMMFKYAQVRLQQPEFLQLASNPNRRFNEGITLWDLQYDVDIYIDSGTFGSMSNQELQSMLAVYNQFGQDPEGNAVFRKPEMIRHALYLTGTPAVERIARDEQELQQVLQQRQQDAERMVMLEKSQGSAA